MIHPSLRGGPRSRAAAFLALVAVLAACGPAGSSSRDPGLDPAGTSPAITTQPASRTVTAGQTATFSVVATGTAPLAYQWRKNGTAISGATSASYTTPATTAADSGASFTVVVTNAAGTATSTAATLTVTTAATPWLYTKAGSNRIYFMNGAQEVEWIGRGVNISDLFLCGYNSTQSDGAWMASADAEAQVRGLVTSAVTGWKANFLRLSLSMNSTSQIAHWSDADPYQYKAAMTRVIDAAGQYPNVYVLVTVRSDTTMTEGDAGNEASYYPTPSTYAVYRELVKSFRNSPQVIIGLTNEGGGTGFSGNPAQLRAIWTDAVAAIRAEEGTGPHHLVAVQGTGYAGDVSYFSQHPLAGDDILYELHGYPPTSAGYTFSNIPVFVGEYGSIDAALAATLFADWESKRISSAAWIFDPHSGCQPDLLQVTGDAGRIVPNAYGVLVRDYLQSHPQ